jgi:hypothetical protein
MQVLDEMVALVRTITEQFGNFCLRFGFELASLVERGRSPPARTGANPPLVSRLPANISHRSTFLSATGHSPDTSRILTPFGPNRIARGAPARTETARPCGFRHLAPYRCFPSADSVQR